jgi:hypothetical protein
VKLLFVKQYLQDTYKGIPLEYSQRLELVSLEDLDVPKHTLATIRGLFITESWQCIKCLFLQKKLCDIVNHSSQHG